VLVSFQTTKDEKMANPHPKTENLKLGRGKRPKLDNKTVAMRMSPHTKETLEAIAQQYDCIYADEPWIAGLLAKIADGELMIVPAPPTPKSERV